MARENTKVSAVYVLSGSLIQLAVHSFVGTLGLEKGNSASPRSSLSSSINIQQKRNVSVFSA